MSAQPEPLAQADYKFACFVLCREVVLFSGVLKTIEKVIFGTLSSVLCREIFYSVSLSQKVRYWRFHCTYLYITLFIDDDTMSAKKTTSLQRGSKSRVSLPSVLKEVKARDQSAQVSGYLLTRSAKSRKWKKRWFVVFNLVLYEFERHEDVSAKRSITLPSYQVVKVSHL